MSENNKFKPTGDQQEILRYLEKQPEVEWISPSRIGKALTGDQESWWTCPRIKRLVAEGMVERNPRGHYRLKR